MEATRWAAMDRGVGIDRITMPARRLGGGGLLLAVLLGTMLTGIAPPAAIASVPKANFLPQPTTFAGIEDKVKSAPETEPLEGNPTLPASPDWVEVASTGNQVTMFVNPEATQLTTISSHAYWQVTGRMDLPIENLRIQLLLGVDCVSRRYMVLREWVFALHSDELLEADAHPPSAADLQRAQPGTLIDSTIDHVCTELS